MTKTDLRISYKLDTARYPLWTKDHFGREYKKYNKESKFAPPRFNFLKGVPTSEYGLWLENKMGNSKDLREKYYNQTKEHSISNYRSNLRKNKEVFSVDYSLWLENLILSSKI